jgi:Zn-dependent peptidase ImmA (M78 family)
MIVGTLAGMEAEIRYLLEWAGCYRAPVNIGEVARRCGLSLCSWAECPPDLSGFLFYGPERPEIVVNGSHTTRRQRFTIAHELAHWLRRDSGDIMLLARTAGQHTRVERETNALAAALLMPAELVRLSRVLPFIGLCRQFDVAKRAMQIRLQELGINDKRD